MRTTRILPRPDETLSSWLALTLGRRQLRYGDFVAAVDRVQPGIAQALLVDSDYPKMRGWRRTIAQVLHVSEDVLGPMGHAPSPWVLQPQARRSVCVACLREDGPPSLQYMRQNWTDAWRTICHRHGMPLIEVPAVGWGWAAAGRATRQQFRALMRRPGKFVDEYRKQWLVLPSPIRSVGEAEVALMGGWSAYYAAKKTADDIFANTEMQVWEDVLTVLSYSWTPIAQSSLAAGALPVHWIVRSQFLRTPPVAPVAQPSLAQFRATSDPAVRRVLVLVAGDAMLGFSHRPNADPASKRYRWGWHHVLVTLPRPARLWLIDRSRAWPAAHRLRIAECEQLRQV